MDLTIPALGAIPAAALLDLVRKYAVDPAPSAEELDERARHIAGIRELADWLEANPFVPLPWRTEATEHFSPPVDVPDGATGIARVREVADRIGIEPDERNEDRTKLTVPFGDGKVSYELIAWHKDGRPAEPADPTGLLYGRGDEAQDPQPSAGRVPPHLEDGRTGEVVDEPLVTGDELVWDRDGEGFE